MWHMHTCMHIHTHAHMHRYTLHTCTDIHYTHLLHSRNTHYATTLHTHYTTHTYTHTRSCDPQQFFHRFPEDDQSSLPDIVAAPLIKTEKGSYAALRSGQRSAIIPSTTGCYRLKGCGHYLDDDNLQLRLPYPSFSICRVEVSKYYKVCTCELRTYSICTDLSSVQVVSLVFCVGTVDPLPLNYKLS